MYIKKTLCTVFACLIALGCLNVPARAACAEEQVSKIEALAPRASGRFSLDIPGNEIFATDKSFLLETGETVTIEANYSPASASVDFGLIAPDGLFYPLRASNGSFKGSIQVNERGDYALAIRNNSSNTISVSGSVNY